MSTSLQRLAAGLAATAGALLMTLGAGPVQAAMINFDDPNALIQLDLAAQTASYSEAGFTISASTALQGAPFLILDGVGTAGTSGLFGLLASQLTLTADGGGPFSLAGFDAGVLFGGGLLHVDGQVAGGPGLSADLTLDALAQFDFSGWTGLTALTLSADTDFLLDSVRVDALAVPLPGSLSLALLALAALGAARGPRRQA